MKKLLSLVLALAITLSCSAALADIGSSTLVPRDAASTVRDITIQPAGDNVAEIGVSPTTGRNLDELEAESGFLGMAVTGNYYPIMVQHNGYHSGLDFSAPWYGSYADVFYELPKSWAGHTRMCMIFNDFLPPFAGGSRSTRVGYLWIRQEWGCPYFFAGKQEDSWPGPYDTNVNHEIQNLGLLTDENTSAAPEDIVIFNGLDGGSKPFLGGKYRVQGEDSEYNLIWDLPYEYTNVLGANRKFKNHTWKFADEIPEGGDPAETVYILYRADQAATGNKNDEDNLYWFNSMFQYEEDENVYTRWIITDLKNPENNPRPFTEKIVAPGTTPTVVDKEKIQVEYASGDDITFANIIVQFVDDKFPAGECPYPILKGIGNADYFMGGKHFKGVWSRETYEDRTVFYGEDGQEIELQPGRTMIVVMDYDTTVNKQLVREVRYE